MYLKSKMLRSIILRDGHFIVNARTYATRPRYPKKQRMNKQAALADYAHLVGTDTSVKLRCHFTQGRTVYKETIGCFLNDVVAHLKDIPQSLPPATTASHVVYNIMMRFCIGIVFVSGFILMLGTVFGILVMCMWFAENFPSAIIAMAIIAFFTCIGWIAI